MANTKLLIKEICSSKGISLTELASRIPGKVEGKSLSLSTLSEKIKDGKFTLTSLESIATALGVGVRDLIAPNEEEISTAPEPSQVSAICPHCGKTLHLTIACES